MDFLACSYGSLCSGCDLLLKSYNNQQVLKKQHLHLIWSSQMRLTPTLSPLPNVDFLTIARSGLRDRVDLSLDSRSGARKIGLFDRVNREIVDLQGCPQMSPALEEWFRDFRRVAIPYLDVARGSIRLRVAPDGRRGVWLDLANLDVKRLLEEQRGLSMILEMGAVEIGQKRKRLIRKSNQLKLDNFYLENWFETYDQDRTIPLYCTVGSFTQPGFAANRALVNEVLRQTRRLTPRSIIEFGSGIGNFTLPLAAITGKVFAYEVDSLALAGLKRAAGEQNLNDKIEIYEGNFQQGGKLKGDAAERFSTADLIFVDPPRSGLMKFIDPLAGIAKSKRPKNFLYVSCFAESFAADVAKLQALGYNLSTLALLDQFPQSRHYEIIASFEIG